MKKFSLFLLLLIATLAVANNASAATLAEKMRGRILIQVEDKGRAWYVEPNTLDRYSLGKAEEAFAIMKKLGLGISEESFQKMNGTAPKNLAGKTLLRVKSKGEAYYVNPLDLKLHFLGKPTDAMNTIKKLGLGIKNSELTKINKLAYLKKESSSSDNNGIKTNISIEYIEKVDCGTVNCFEQKFKACTPSEMKAEMGTINYSYKIIGPKENKCQVQIKFQNNPNKDWINKEMTCLFNNKKTLSAASDEIMQDLLANKNSFGCSGELVGLYQSMAK